MHGELWFCRLNFAHFKLTCFFDESSFRLILGGVGIEEIRRLNADHGVDLGGEEGLVVEVDIALNFRVSRRLHLLRRQVRYLVVFASERFALQVPLEDRASVAGCVHEHVFVSVELSLLVLLFIDSFGSVVVVSVVVQKDVIIRWEQPLKNLDYPLNTSVIGDVVRTTRDG